jgi:hypothetical protein
VADTAVIRPSTNRRRPREDAAIARNMNFPSP